MNICWHTLRRNHRASESLEQDVVIITTQVFMKTGGKYNGLKGRRLSKRWVTNNLIVLVLNPPGLSCCVTLCLR